MDLGATGYDIYYGHGRVNAQQAVIASLESVSSDTQAPSVSIPAPSAGVKVSGDLAVDVSASDNVGVDRVALYANGLLVAETNTAPYQFTVDTLGFADGSLTLSAKAWDKAGNEGVSKSVTVTVDNIPDPVDSQPPVVKITSPADGATLTKKVTITVSATDNVKVTGIKCYIDGVLKASTTAASLQYVWNTSSAAAGVHTITAVASDAAGNEGVASIGVKK